MKLHYLLILLLVFFGSYCRSQPVIPDSRFSICAAYTLSTLTGEDIPVDNYDHEVIPYGLSALLKYTFNDTWSIEGGIQSRVRSKGAGSYLENDDVTKVPYTYSTWYLDLPLMADLHAYGLKRFHFNITGGIQQTWMFFALDATDSSGFSLNYREQYGGMAVVVGLEESYAITSRISIEASQTPTFYFIGALKDATGPELKIGIEYSLRSSH